MALMKNPYINKIRDACEIVELLENMHVFKRANGKNLCKNEILNIRKEWYLDRLLISEGNNHENDHCVPSDRKI